MSPPRMRIPLDPPFSKGEVQSGAALFPPFSKGGTGGIFTVKSLKTSFFVIPAKAGIQEIRGVLDPGFRRGDDFDDFLRLHQKCRAKIESSSYAVSLHLLLFTCEMGKGHKKSSPALLRSNVRRLKMQALEKLRESRKSSTGREHEEE